MLTLPKWELWHERRKLTQAIVGNCKRLVGLKHNIQGFNSYSNLPKRSLKWSKFLFEEYESLFVWNSISKLLIKLCNYCIYLQLTLQRNSLTPYLFLLAYSNLIEKSYLKSFRHPLLLSLILI